MAARTFARDAVDRLNGLGSVASGSVPSAA